MGEKPGIIACFYDCDQTLTAQFMQEPMFRSLGIEPKDFWADNDRLKQDAAVLDTDVNADTVYMVSLLKYIEEGKIPPLSNSDFKKYGSLIKPFPGLPDFFLRTKKEVAERYGKDNIKLEHYIISTGLRKMIQGSPLNVPGAIDQIFASEFLEYNGVIRWPARDVGFIEKTRYLYEANKGVNVDRSINVNQRLPPEKRRIYFENMIYVGDGFSDVPCMALTIERGGTSIGVYDSSHPKAKHEVEGLLQDGRVSCIAQTDYRKDGEASEVIEKSIIRIAERIVQSR